MPVRSTLDDLHLTVASTVMRATSITGDNEVVAPTGWTGLGYRTTISGAPTRTISQLTTSLRSLGLNDDRRLATSQIASTTKVAIADISAAAPSPEALPTMSVHTAITPGHGDPEVLLAGEISVLRYEDDHADRMRQGSADSAPRFGKCNVM